MRQFVPGMTITGQMGSFHNSEIIYCIIYGIVAILIVEAILGWLKKLEGDRK